MASHISNAALIPLVELQMRKTQFTYDNQQSHRLKTQRVHMVHQNVGLRPPSRGIGCLIIQIMEITTDLQALSFPPISHLPLQAYINLYTFTQETNY